MRRCRDYIIRPRLESGNAPETNFWSLVGLVPTYHHRLGVARVESSLPEPKRRQSQPSGEDETDGDVVRCVVSGNTSAGRMSADRDRGEGEIILGTGQACKEVS